MKVLDLDQTKEIRKIQMKFVGKLNRLVALRLLDSREDVLASHTFRCKGKRKVEAELEEVYLREGEQIIGLKCSKKFERLGFICSRPM